MKTRIGRKSSAILNSSVFLLLSLIFYVRGKVLPSIIPFSSSYIIPVLALFILIILLVYSNFKFVRVNKLMLAFIVISNISLVLSSILNGSLVKSVEFFLEWNTNVLIYYIFIVIFQKHLELKNVLNYIVFSSVFASIPIVNLANSLSSVRRIGTAGKADLEFAAGHVGPSLAVAGLVLILILQQRQGFRFGLKKILQNGLLILILISMVLTGSKAAIIGFMLSFVILMIYVKYLRWKAVIFVGSMFIAIISSFTVKSSKYEHLLNRFTQERVLLAIEQRAGSSSRATNEISPVALVFGENGRYEPINETNPIHYPHNFILSTILHLGFFSGLILCLVFAELFYYLIRNILSTSNRAFWLLLLSMSSVQVLNIMTSGRLTRTMVIFVIFALFHSRNKLVKAN